MKKAIISIFGVLTILGLFITGCAQNVPPPKQPEEMLKDGIKKLTNVDSHAFEFTSKMTLLSSSGKQEEKVNYYLNLTGALDLKDVQEPRIKLKADGSFADFQMIVNKEALYGNLTRLTLSEAGFSIPKDFESYLKKWWKIPIPPGVLKEIAVNVPHGSDDTQLTADQKKLKKLFEDTRFFKDMVYTGIDTIKGEPSYRYSAKFDKESVKDFIVKSLLPGEKSLNSEELKNLDEMFKKLELNPQIWIGKDTGIVNKISARVDISSVAAKPSSSLETVTAPYFFDFELILWDFNKPVTVEAPKDWLLLPVDSIFGSLFSQAGAIKQDSTLPVDVPADAVMPNVLPSAPDSVIAPVPALTQQKSTQKKGK